MQGPTKSQLRKLLHRYNEVPTERDRVLADIDHDFRQQVAVLVIDTCGFSRTVKKRGIVYFLALLERLERIVRPSVDEHGGRVLRRHADDVLTVFPDPAAAVAASREILRAMQGANAAAPRDEEIQISIGIGFGELLIVGDDDAWGDEMNLASKLGEDMAAPDEVLLTQAAYEALGETDEAFEQRQYSISGVEIPAYKLL